MGSQPPMTKLRSIFLTSLARISAESKGDAPNILQIGTSTKCSTWRLYHIFGNHWLLRGSGSGHFDVLCDYSCSYHIAFSSHVIEVFTRNLNIDFWDTFWVVISMRGVNVYTCTTLHLEQTRYNFRRGNGQCSYWPDIRAEQKSAL